MATVTGAVLHYLKPLYNDRCGVAVLTTNHYTIWPAPVVIIKHEHKL